MSLKKYMIIDLSILCLISILLETLTTYLVNYMYVGAFPTTVISLLLTFLAIARWGYKGLIVIPFCAVGNLIGGQFLVFKGVTYDWRVFLSVMLGLASLSINLIPFHRWKTNVVIKNNYALCGMMIGNIVLYELVRGISYSFILRGTSVHLLSNAWGYDVTAMVILFVMGFILKKQGTLYNFKDKIIAEREQAELDRKIESEFTIEAVDSKDDNEKSSNS